MVPMRHSLGTFESWFLLKAMSAGALSGRNHGHFMGTSSTALWRFANRVMNKEQGAMENEECKTQNDKLLSALPSALCILHSDFFI
jgi:hypothetical protein